MNFESIPTRDAFPPRDGEAPAGVQFGGRMLRRRAGLIIGTLLLGLAGAEAYLQSQSPTYVSSAKLLIEPQRGLNDMPFSADGPDVDSAQVESQVEVLRASIIAEAVVRKLNLVGDPEFVPPRSPKTTWQSLLEDLENAAARAPGADKLLSQLATDPVREDPPRTADEMFNTAVASFGERISVRRLGQSNAIEIDFAANSAAKAQRIAAQTVETYLSGAWRAPTSPNAFRRFNDDMMRKSLAVSNARLISEATPPLGKSSPKTALVLAFAAAASLFVGVALAIWLEGRRPAGRAGAREGEEAGEVAPRRERAPLNSGGYSLTDARP